MRIQQRKSWGSARAIVLAMLVAAAFLGLTATVTAQITATNSAEVNVVLGGLFPTTGPQCVEGIGALFGARMAVKALNGLDPTMGSGSPVDNKWKQWGQDTLDDDGNPAPFHLNVTLEESNTQSSKSQALFEVDRYIHAGVDALIGPLVSEVSESVSLLAKYDNIPVISYNSPMTKLTSQELRLDTFMRTFPSDKAVIKASVDLLHHFEWEGVTLITTNDEDGVDTANEFNYWTAESEEPGKRLAYKSVVYVDDSISSIRGKLQEIKAGKWRITGTTTDRRPLHQLSFERGPCAPCVLL